MPTLHYTIGLPGSGKTTWARRYVHNHPGTVRTNRDDLRAMLHHGLYTPDNERIVVEVQHAMIRDALRAGRDVVVDDTNLKGRTVMALEDLADRAGARINPVGFLDVPVDVCVERDAARPQPVGETVIRAMARRALLAEVPA